MTDLEHIPLWFPVLMFAAGGAICGVICWKLCDLKWKWNIAKLQPLLEKQANDGYKLGVIDGKKLAADALRKSQAPLNAQ